MRGYVKNKRLIIKERIPQDRKVQKAGSGIPHRRPKLKKVPPHADVRNGTADSSWDT